ncbi:MAG: methyltransferase domain-containing protein [Bacteroidales bacterium]|nr:methyltransferase domain-containing protein [Bacteroidales bacterium]
MLRKRVKQLIKAWHNCLHLDTLIAQNSDTVSNTIDNAIRQQHHDAIRQRYELLFLQSKEFGISKEKYGNNELIVSLTSFGQRIHNVYLTIESIMQQTLKPNKIILWLDQDEFTLESLPTSLRIQQKKGLEIRFTEDVKSYKKLIPALAEYPEDTIITIDDDCIYPINFIDVLYLQHKQHPKDVICPHAHIIEFDETGDPKPYLEWTDSPKDRSRASFSYLPVGFAGVLYPPHSLHPDVMDRGVFMSLAPMADDLWFKIMSLRNHVQCRTVPIYMDIFDWITVTNNKSDLGLYEKNILYNNAQLKNLLSRYSLSQYDFDVFEKTSERIVPELYQETVEQWVLFLKHLYAYEFAKSLIKKGMKVLEIGCGDGYGASFLADSEAEVTAVDIDSRSINYAKHKYEKSNLTFRVYDGYSMPFKEQQFDMVLSFQVIEHVSDLNVYFRSILQMLKPGGIVLITTPNRTYRLSEGQKPWNPFHLTEYNESSMKSVANLYLPHYHIYSITSNQEVLSIEKERCRSMRDDYDETEFRYVFKRSNYINYYSTSDFFLTKENIDDGLDILLTNTELQ